MDSPKKKRGRRPRNGIKGPWQFRRAMMVIHAYTKARKQGEKHTAALNEAVDFVRQFDAKMRISKSGVRRVLAEFLPKHSELALTVSFSILEGDDALRRRLLAQKREFDGSEVPTEMTDQNLRKPLKTFKFGFCKRPNYPRHNTKSPNP